MKIEYALKNVDQGDRKAFLDLVDKMLRDAYLKGYNHGLTGEPPHRCYFSLDDETGIFEDCMTCGKKYVE